MIIGHIGVAFAARRRWERISLVTLMLATFAPDALRAPLAAAGLHWTQANLYTHALPWCLAVVALCGAFARAVSGSRRTALVVMAVVASHLVLDVVSGKKALWAGGPLGLDVEDVEQVELAIESVLLFAGWVLLRRSSVQSPRWVRHWVLPLLLVAIETGYLAGTISQRPYRTRCFAAPFTPCTDSSPLTRKWNTTPFW